MNWMLLVVAAAQIVGASDCRRNDGRGKACINNEGMPPGVVCTFDKRRQACTPREPPPNDTSAYCNGADTKRSCKRSSKVLRDYDMGQCEWQDRQCIFVANEVIPPPARGVVTCGAAIPYNQLRQKSSHNAYERDEALIDQMQYHRIRSLELDIWRSKTGSSSEDGSWFVFHGPTPFNHGTVCNRLRHCLQEFKAFHDANPNHEVVTVWIDMKDGDGHTSPHGPAELDAVLRDSGLPLYDPRTLIGNASTLKAAVANGWPTTADLQGKFIIVFTDNVEGYCNNDQDCNQRAAFVKCKAKSAYEVQRTAGFCVFYNQKCTGDEGDGLRHIYDAGYVSRCYRHDDVNSGDRWRDAADKKAHHIATNKINIHENTNIKSHNGNGWPFEVITGDDVTCRQPNTDVIGVKVDSGDIWGKYGDFAFMYRYEDTRNVWFEYTVMVNNVNSNVNDWAKAGLMVRDEITSKNRGESSRYFAILRAADSKKLRAQYRTCHKCDTHETTVDIPPTGDSIDQENRCFLKLRVRIGSDSTSVEGYGSQNGHQWQLIKSQTFDARFEYHGLAASSNGDSGNSDGTKVKHLFTNFEKNGETLTAADLSVLKVGNDVPTAQLFDGFGF